MNQATVSGPISGAILRDVGPNDMISFGVGTTEGTVPVEYHDPDPRSAQRMLDLNDGDTVTVEGTVRTRWFRHGGATHSRTTVHATTITYGRPQ